LIRGRPRPQIQPLSAKLFRPAQLRKLRGREHVAAVCYQFRDGAIEFLLVQTRSGRWTFPKGGAEPGLTHAQSAALEAFEEAGVHGRMEELSFTRYPIGKAETGSNRFVNAHLCEVLRLGRPQEANRRPTWFSAEKAKRRLREDRTAEKGTELARVVDRAVSRIQRLYLAAGSGPDALQKVQFEISEETVLRSLIREDLFLRYIRRQPGPGARSANRVAAALPAPRQLSAGDPAPAPKSQIIEISNRRRSDPRQKRTTRDS
jgi:8-oxo-dGTP pyrophosphatase MutT (NUDIX family)